MNREDCAAFLQWALPRLRMRWVGFRKVPGQVCKRIARRTEQLGLPGLTVYRRVLQADPDEWRVLDSLCRITISRFQRDRGVFEVIGDRVLPELAAAEAAPLRGPDVAPRDPIVRCWSAGCASGEEPYTLVILWHFRLRERFPGVRLQITATDADEVLLERARVGCYPASALRELRREWVEKAFESVEGELCLRTQFRAGVELVRQDIRSRMPADAFDLVLCRNLVFTYFDPGLQVQVLAALLERVRPGGLLVLGAHEELPAGDWPLERLVTAAPVFRRT